MKTYRLKEVALLLAMLLIPGVVSAKEIDHEGFAVQKESPRPCLETGPVRTVSYVILNFGFRIVLHSPAWSQIRRLRQNKITKNSKQN